MGQVKLYMIVDGELVLKDYGVPAKADMYAQQGYIVEYPCADVLDPSKAAHQVASR